MYRPLFRKWRLLFFGTCSLLVWFLIQRQTKEPPERTPFQSPQTAQAMIDRTEPLCRLLVPNVMGLHYLADAKTFPSPNGGERVLWSVVCLTEGQKEVAHFVWEAENNELFSVEQVNSQEGEQSLLLASPKNVPTILSPAEEKQLVQAAWRWLDAMGIAAKSHRWQLAAPPRPTPLRVVWAIQVHSEDREALLRLDQQTYMLKSLITHRRR